MLKMLTVDNYALIDRLQMQFGNGMNIITGETGAGKSVLMGALGLLLGDRADSNSLLDVSRKCIIEGEFLSSQKVKLFLENANLDGDDDLIIRREINKDGKSRSFINDTPVNLSQLRELGNLLVDIHSQHETLLLEQSGFQLSVIDAFAAHGKFFSEYKLQFSKYRTLKDELSRLQEEERKLRTDQDYLQFQFNELDEAKLAVGEQQKLEEELSALSHAEEIRSGVSRFSDMMNGSEENLLSGINSAANLVAGLEKYFPKLEDPAKRLRSVHVELKDIEYEIDQLSAEIKIDPKRLEIVNDRLDLIYRLQQKHHLNAVEDLIHLRDELSAKLLSFSSLEGQVLKTTNELKETFAKVKEIAQKLSANRQAAIPLAENKIKKILAELSMPNAVLKIENTLLDEDEINSTGKDKLKFLFSANKGIPYAEIGKVASGGELSRLMLSLKAIITRMMELPTIIFDEIDTGVSGETAFKMGKVMQGLSTSHQLIAITHLPQIASRGKEHFFVYKEIIGKKTFTKVKQLSSDERVLEIARMLSGDKPTAVAMENAKELLRV